MSALVDTVAKHQSQATLINIYIREAHPIEDATLSSFVHEGNTQKGICYRISKTLEDARAVASDYMKTLQGTPAADIPLLLDDPATEAIKDAYEALPERLVVVDAPSMTVAYCSGQGPFQYDLNDLAAFLDKRCAELENQPTS